MIKVFFSYSHKDEKFREELDAHLSPLRRNKIIEVWNDRVIDAGKEFDKVIDSNLLDSNIILLLISSNFINSDYCYDIEMEEALNMHNSGSASVIPIILQPCAWSTITPLTKLKVCPTDGKAITLYSNQHEAFMNVAESIKKVAENIRLKQSLKNKTLEEIRDRNSEILEEADLLTEQLEKEKALYSSRHETLIEWLAQNNELLVPKISDYIKSYHSHLELSYSIPESRSEKRTFNRNISHFIERLETSLIEERTKALDEPGFEISFNKNIYKLALNFLFDRVPQSVPTESKDIFKFNIDYLLTRI